MHHGVEDQALGIDEEMVLAACDFLPSVITTWTFHTRRLYGLPLVDHVYVLNHWR